MGEPAGARRHGASYLQGVAWLGEHAEPGAEVCVPIAGALPVWDSPRPDLKFGCGPGARYEMFVTGYDKLADYDGSTPVFRVSRYDSDLLRIYRRPRPDWPASVTGPAASVTARARVTARAGRCRRSTPRPSSR